ncbi:DUF2336 domain-containing protein [Humitalea sp. 24SJ18S-53]|uniref:DUF2336 domain-containing protein n=1 Tax=Humitalea sp. 24SJ18S-53 TaxID=3422307 RepID=UPI003D678E68
MIATLDYETARRVARDGAEMARAVLAADPDARPEMLYFLAADPVPAVRAAVAANPATPAQANRLLGADENEAVRVVLARRLGSLAPGLSPARHDRLARLAWDTLCLLAEDAAVGVRAVIADAAAGLVDQAQRGLIVTLARDAAVTVSGPVLRASPLLTDGDLLALVSAPPTPETLTAIARRPSLAEAVCDAIAATADTPAVAALLANPSAAIREATLDTLAAQAAADPAGRVAWHAPLVARPRLPPAAIRLLADCVARDLLAQLADRIDLDPATREELHRRVAIGLVAKRAGLPDPAHGRHLVHGMANPQDIAESTFLRAAAAGDAVACREMLIQHADVPPEIVDRAMTMRNAKALMSLSWRAGLSPRCAAVVQAILARLPPDEVIHAAPDGAWPLALAEMRWHVDMLGQRAG